MSAVRPFSHDDYDQLQRFVFDAQCALVDVRAFAVHNTGCDEGLDAAKRLAVAAAEIQHLTQGAVDASP